MATITRRLAHDLRAVCRRAFGTRRLGPAVCFTVSAGTLTAKARCGNVAVEYRGPGEGRAETLWLPFQLLNDCQGKKDAPVQIEAAGPGGVTAQWSDKNVPQIVQYDAQSPTDADKLPSPPESLVENPPGLLKALVEAWETTDSTAIRYAVDCLQLRGAAGALAATDGRQILVQTGYHFPWQENLLVPGNKVFASPEFAGDSPVLVGKAGDWIAFRVGPWTIWLSINKDGRFPDVDRHIPRPATAKARCLFSQGDAEFLDETLPRLPSNDDCYWPVTLDLNGQVAIRAKPSDSTRPTEVVLCGSSFSGEPVRLNTNRQYLQRAIRMGFRELLVYGDQTPVACLDDRRQYVWALLDPESAIPAAENAIRIESSSAGVEVPAVQVQTQIERKVSAMTETATSQTAPVDTNGHASGRARPNGEAKTNGRVKTNGQTRKTTAHKQGHQDVAGLIQQAEGLRTALRETLARNNELLKGLKRHRRQSRAVQNTLASLRQLKTLGV